MKVENFKIVVAYNLRPNNLITNITYSPQPHITCDNVI